MNWENFFNFFLSNEERRILEKLENKPDLDFHSRVLEFQEQRHKTNFTLKEKILAKGLIPIYRRKVDFKYNIEYMQEGKILSPSLMPSLPEYSEFALGPHLEGEADILAGFETLFTLPGDDFVYVMIARRNLDLNETKPRNVFISRNLVGGIPIGRLPPLGNDRQDRQFRNELKTLKHVIGAPDLILAVAIDGSRQTDGMPMEMANTGLETLIINHLKYENVEHNIFLAAFSLDIISREFYVTLLDPVKVNREIIAANFPHKADLTRHIYGIILQAMKIADPHIYSSLLRKQASLHKEDFIFYPTTFYNEANEIIRRIERDPNINYNSQSGFIGTFKKLSGNEDFIDFCFRNEILYNFQGKRKVDVRKLNYTWNEYRDNHIPKEVKADKLSDTKIGEYTMDFSKDYPIQYMDRMSRHLVKDYL